MSRNNRRDLEKFSCSTSRFLLPTFRRPNYRQSCSGRAAPPSLTQAEVFSKWSEEEGQLYKHINSALLNDDYETIQKHASFINDLKTAIRESNTGETVTTYRGLVLDLDSFRKEYKEGLSFLWPTFTCTTRNKEVASRFGNFLFVVDAPGEGLTYCADIARFSVFPEEEEILFYPYSGFVVKEIIRDARVVKLSCVDTLKVEEEADKEIPEEVSLYDKRRNMFVYFSKKSPNLCWADAKDTSKRWLIGQNMNGYWDAPYRYHHKNGYFVNVSDNDWEEWQNNKLYVKFKATVG